MKYVITKEQLGKLERVIIDFFNRNLTPHDGWKPEEYKDELESNYELFIFIDESDDYDANIDSHIFYSSCYNPEYETNEDECPFVLIDNSKYSSLNAYFGDFWKPFFIEWFHSKTKLPKVKSIDPA